MPLSKTSLQKKAKRIKLIAMDVDGVLTNGEIIVLQSGEEVKSWNAKDRLLIAAMRDLKVPIKFAWITGRKSEAVSKGSEDLSIFKVVQKCHDKKAALIQILDETGLKPDEAAFIGDDLIDLAVMRYVGFSACPKDAVKDVLLRSSYVSPFNGGQGVVRDVIEFILRAQGKWDNLIESFL